MRRYFLNGWLLLFAVVLGLYVFFNPPLSHMFLNLRPLGFSFVFILSFCGIGWPLARFISPNKLRNSSHHEYSWIDELLTAFALGLGTTALFVFVLGIFGVVNLMLYSLWTLVGLGIAAYGIGRKWIPISIKANGTFNRNSSESSRCCNGENWAGKQTSVNGLTIFGILVPVLFLLQAIPPLVSPVVSTDSLQYHLLIPKIFLASGKISYIPSLVESNYPCMVEYLYMPVMGLANDIVCKCLHFWAGIFVLISMGRLVSKVSPKSNRLLAPAFFISMPVAIVIFSWAWNDLFFVFFLLLAVSYLLNYHMAVDKQQCVRDLLMAGIMVGLASWMKYTVVMVVFSLIILMGIALIRWGWKWKHLFWFFVPTGLISLLVFVKNLIFTGNPFYPFLHRLFPSPYWNDTVAAYFIAAVRRWEISDWNWTTYFTFPFHITLKPVMIDTHTGILPLILIPMLFVRLEGKGVTFLKGFIGTYMIVWLIIHSEARSLLTMFAVFFCVAAIGLEQKVWSLKSFRRPLIFLLCAAVLLGLGITIVTNYHLTNTIRYFIGLESRTDFLKREAKSQLTYDWLNNKDEVTGVLLVGFFGPYYLERPVLFSSVCDPPIAEVLTGDVADEASLRTKLLDSGISHVAIDKRQYDSDHSNGLYSWTKKQRQVFERFIVYQCKPKAKFGTEIIYQIKK